MTRGSVSVKPGASEDAINEARESSPVPTHLLYALAFLSGSAALVYQVAWTRMLSLTFGSSTLAVSAVVAAFLGGMGIGAWLYHRVGDRVGAALRVYGGIEIGIAVSTAVFTLIFSFLPGWFASLAGLLPPGLAMNAFRIASVFALLVLPSALMGATYPALCSAMIHSRQEVERHLGWIYGFNTLGAAAGALVTGVVLIEFLGSRGSVLAANAVNLTVAACALLLDRRQSKRPQSTPATPPDESLPTDLPFWLTGLVLFGSGFATLGYEIVWFRALRYLLGNGTYVLTAVLVIFLLGLGFGSLLYRHALRSGRPERNLGLCQLGIAVLALAAIGAEQWILIDPRLSSRLSIFSASLGSQPWIWRLAVGSGVATAIMLPATLWMGLSFPLASRLFLGSVRAVSSRVGLAYLLSNLGSILGAVLAALWVLPTLGTVGGTKLLAGVNLGLAVLILGRIEVAALRAAIFGAVLVTVSIALALPPRLGFQGQALAWGDEVPERIFEEEADLGTVQVLARPARPFDLGMSIDGSIIGATQGFLPYLYAKQVLLAHLPMLLDRDIRNVLTIGVASASTLKTLARYPWIESLDAVEINPGVVRASSFFTQSSVFDDPRVGLAVEDAIHHMLRTEDRYDLIASDAKQNMGYAGNSKVLSAEFYRYSLARLSPCGLFAQGIPLSHDQESFRMILRTFRSVFPEMEIFVDPPYTVVMVGSRCPVAGRARPTEDELRSNGAGAEIESLFVPDAATLPALWLASGAEIEPYLGPGSINSWDRTLLEFISYRAIAGSWSDRAENFRVLLAPRDADPSANPGFAKGPLVESMHLLNRAYLSFLEEDRSRARELLGQALTRSPDNPQASEAAKTIR